eukprot:5520577-Amphidinium_carterae.1
MVIECTTHRWAVDRVSTWMEDLGVLTPWLAIQTCYPERWAAHAVPPPSRYTKTFECGQADCAGDGVPSALHG